MSSDTVVLRYLMASQKLQIVKSEVDHKATTSLQKVKLYARNRGDLESAIISAGYYAKKQGRTIFVYAGDSFGHSVWRASYKESDYLDTINNSGKKLLSVTPDLVVTWHELKDPRDH